MAATLKQRQAAAAVLRDGGSYADAARVAQVNRSTVIRWATEDEGGPALPDAATISTPRAVLESLLLDPNPRVRLDAARALVALDADSPQDAIPDFDKMTMLFDLPPGEQSYSELVVHCPADAAPDAQPPGA